MIRLIAAAGGGTFGKIHPLFILKALRKLKIEGNFLNLVKKICEKPTSTIMTARV